MDLLPMATRTSCVTLRKSYGPAVNAKGTRTSCVTLMKSYGPAVNAKGTRTSCVTLRKSYGPAVHGNPDVMCYVKEVIWTCCSWQPGRHVLR